MAEPEGRRSTRQSVPAPLVEPGRTICIICETQKKKIPNSTTKQSTSQLLTEDAESRLRRAAAIRKDERILIAIGSVSSLIAREVHYHKYCYNAYTRETSLQALLARETEPAATGESTIADNSAQDNDRRSTFLSAVRSDLFEDCLVLSLGELTTTYNSVVAPDTAARKDKVKGVLLEHFGDSVTFGQRPARNRSQLVFATSRATDIIVRAYADKTDDSDSDESDSDEVFLEVPGTDDANVSSADAVDDLVVRHDSLRIVYHAAQILRSAIQEFPHTGDGLSLSVVDTERSIPDVVFNFFVWLLSDCHHDVVQHDKIATTDHVLRRRICSISQDSMFLVTSRPPPKHTVLGVTLHHLYRSEKLVTMLNRLGHCIAYSQVLERETEMADKKVRDGELVDSLPSNIDPEQPFYHVADNNDLNEETLDGKGTTHCTNTIIVQPSLGGQAGQAPGMIPVEPARKRKRAVHIAPEVLPEVVCRHNVNPQCSAPVQLQQLESMYCPSDDTSLLDFLWRLSRACRDGDLCNPVVAAAEGVQDQSVPAWTAFNALLQRSSIPARSAIGYCPVINSSPTDLSTVYALLTKCLSRCHSAGMSFTLIVLDQAIYAKALDIVSHRTDEFSSVVLRMGAFHIACTFLAVIGKRFRDGGLMDVLVESGVGGPASVSSALDGRQYNRAVRYHKIVAEAMERLRWKSFIAGIPDSDQMSEVQASLAPSFIELQACITSENATALSSSPALCDLFKEYSKFTQEEAKSSPTFRFWSSYLDMVSLLLRFIRASRTADWGLHLQCVLRMLPWCFAYDRLNYARYMSYYWLQMTQLADTHPDADTFLRQGGFSVQRSENAFARVPSDQAIEQSINRATKTTGGIVGFSRHPATVQRWVLTAHERAAVADLCLEHCGLDDSAEERGAFHKECQPGRLARDEKDVLRVVDTVTKLFNPFRPATDNLPVQLTNIASGVEASAEVADHLLEAEERGRQSFHEFVQGRLTTGTSTAAFHDPLKKLNLKTFSVKNKKKSVNSTTDILRSDRSIFSRIALIAQTRQMDMREVLSYPLGPLPWALATTSGTLVKTSKSTLLPLLTDGVAAVDAAPETSGALVVDAMALLRSLKVGDLPGTFGEFAEFILDRLCRHFSSYSRIDFVVDTYRDVSIKDLERTSRASDGTLRQHVCGPNQALPQQFSKFLAVGANKEELLAFLVSQWKQPRLMAKIPNQKVLVITCGVSCSIIRYESGTVSAHAVAALESTHEEADTRLLLHAHHAASTGYSAVTIKSPDTDVAVLATAVCHAIPAALYFLTGTGRRLRLIDVNAVSGKLGGDVCDALPGFHAFTGCDTTSAFAHRGKKAGFKLLVGNSPSSAAARQVFQAVGKDFNPLSEECLAGLERVVCALYNVANCTTVNDARYRLFSTKFSQSNQLPPCRDALVKHCARAHYQAAIWRRCLLPRPEVPVPHEADQGWSLDGDGCLAVDWLTLPPAPKSLLEFLSCACKTGCKTGNCSCRRHKLPCTDACGCRHGSATAPCTNGSPTVPEEEDTTVVGEDLIGQPDRDDQS